MMRNESKTLFIPLYGKALMSREGFLQDPAAERIVDACGFDFSRVDQSRKLAIYMGMRAERFDAYAADFVREYPNGLILQLGVGLDSRVQRVKCENPWWELDFPEVIALRRQYFPENERCRYVAAPATPTDWLRQLPRAEHALVLAEGLSMYLTELDMQQLMLALQRYFGRTLFIFDAYSKLAARLSPLKNPVNAVKARINFAMDDPQSLITGMQGVKCVINDDIITPEAVARLKGADHLRFRFMGRAGKKLYRIYGYTLEAKKK